MFNKMWKEFFGIVKPKMIKLCAFKGKTKKKWEGKKSHSALSWVWSYE